MTDPKIVAALVAGFVTISLFVVKGVSKPFWETYFHKFKLKSDHEYEQRKKIKEAISKYKVPLLDSAESLNNRILNFSNNCEKDWLRFKDKEKIKDKYYLQSFCYRYLTFFAWCRKVEQEMVFLDSTLSDEEDLYFVKYLKAMKNIFCDVSIFEGLKYDDEQAVDHFFTDEMLSMADSLITETGVVSFSEFQSWNVNKYIKVVDYFSSISKGRDCNKWYVIHGFHFVLMAFLSKYGYDYQATSKENLKKLYSLTPKNKIANNLYTMLSEAHLDSCKNIEMSIGILRS